MATLFALKICNSATPLLGGGTQRSITGGGCFLRARPLRFYIPLLTKKVPLPYTFYWKMVPLSLSLLFLISKLNLFRTYHLSALKIPVFPYPFTHLNSWNSYPFIYLKPEKGTLYPFRAELPRERVPPLGSHLRINKRESMKNKTCWASYRAHDIPFQRWLT